MTAVRHKPATKTAATNVYTRSKVSVSGPKNSGTAGVYKAQRGTTSNANGRYDPVSGSIITTSQITATLP